MTLNQWRRDYDLNILQAGASPVGGGMVVLLTRKKKPETAFPGQ
jgi:RNA 3'-terminal phosphate cyclase